MPKMTCVVYLVGEWMRSSLTIHNGLSGSERNHNEADDRSCETRSTFGLESKWLSKRRGLMKIVNLFARTVLLFAFIASILGPLPVSRAQAQSTSTDVLKVLDAMTPEERVGQLFLVTFQGTNTNSESQIYNLITNHHVGGVVLLAENDNFLGAPDTLSGAHQLIGALQNIEAQTL